MSGKRKPDVRGLLLEGHFGVSRNLPAADPLTMTPMILEIDRIKPYDRKPRRVNPRFPDKASIRAQAGRRRRTPGLGAAITCGASSIHR